MTGFGEAHYQGDDLTLAFEVRTLNNRHLKITVRGSEPYPMLEPELEKIIRRHIRRGTVLVQVRRQRRANPADFRIDPVALRSYLDQIHHVCDDMGQHQWVGYLYPNVLMLPGVIPQQVGSSSLSEEEWVIAEKTLQTALEHVSAMRRDEGEAMAQELRDYRQRILGELDQIRDQLPTITEAYRQRLQERINQSLKELNVQVEPEALIREVALFADRSDVAEEVVRLASHLEQFQDVMTQGKESPGRKLEFLMQEMLRETNTIGSKASDMTVSRHVVEIKATLEKIRELLQNVE